MRCERFSGSGSTRATTAPDRARGAGRQRLDDRETARWPAWCFGFDGTAGDEAVTPALRALHEEKAAIEARIGELRRVKAQLPLERYEDELETLLVELALKNREIRAAGGR